MKVWITKYALTKGVYEAETEQTEPYPDIISVDRYQYFQKGEWHTSLEAAKAKAEEMRLAKIKSLGKSLAKFKKLVFLPRDN